MTTIKAVSDIHGQFNNFPPSKFGKCDLIVLAGDIYEEKIPGHRDLFDDYIIELAKIAPVLYTCGNHDKSIGFLVENNSILHREVRIPYTYNNIFYLISKETTSYNDYKLASRWYNMIVSVDVDLAIWNKAPFVDLIVSHSPPYGHLDKTNGGHRIGSLGLTGYIYRHQPKVVICGHNHEGKGVMQIGETKIYNVAQKITKIII